MLKNLFSSILFVGCGLCAHGQQLPLVYDQEHTGKHFPTPDMPGYDQLPECRELPESQYPEVEAFLDKFLLGKPTDTDNIQISVLK